MKVNITASLIERPALWCLCLLAVVAAGPSCSGGVGGDGLAAPSNLTASLQGTSVNLTWKGNAGNADFFEIERKTTLAFSKIATLAVGAASYLDDLTSAGETYHYRVRATTGTLASRYSNEAEIAVPGGITGTGGTGTGGSNGSGGAVGSGGGGGAVGSGGAIGSGGASGAGGATGGGGAIGSGGMGKGGNATGGAGTGGASGTGGSPPAAVTFRNNVVPILVKGCGSVDANCHFEGQAVGRSGSPFFCQVAWLSTVDKATGSTFVDGPNVGKPSGCPDFTLHERLTQIRTMLCGTGGAATRPRYVVPRDLTRSVLYQVLAGNPANGFGLNCETVGVNAVTRMPKVPAPPAPMVHPPLTTAQIQTIADWITAGAKND